MTCLNGQTEQQRSRASVYFTDSKDSKMASELAVEWCTGGSLLRGKSNACGLGSICDARGSVSLRCL